jgi:hypothetical protein
MNEWMILKTAEALRKQELDMLLPAEIESVQAVEEGEQHDER